jgi:hypothetical protein
MSISLVSIHHPIDAGAIIPFIGSRGPLNRIPVPTWQAKSIAQQGFVVVVHEEPYDPVAERNKRADALHAALNEVKPAATEPAPVIVDELPPAVIEPPVQVPPVEILEETPVEQPPIVEDAKIEETDPIINEQIEAVDGEPVAEEHVLSEEELANLRAKVDGLKTLAEAEAIISEFGFELDPSVTRLKDIKVALLAAIDGTDE